METLLKISAHDNAAVKQYRKLARSRKERTKTGLFVLEGFRLVSDAVKNGAALTQLFWTEDGLARGRQRVCRTCCTGTRCALVSDSLAAELSQTEHTQGVFAVCQIPDPPAPFGADPYRRQLCRAAPAAGPRKGPHDPRTADALGLDGVIYSASCDIYSPKVVRATMGSLFRVPLCCVPEIEPVLAACRDAGVESCAAVVSGQAELVGQCLFRKGTAVVIGNEGNGLPEEVSAACDRRVTIPMHGTIESLNAAMAAGIILWEVQKAAAAGNGGQ